MKIQNHFLLMNHTRRFIAAFFFGASCLILFAAPGARAAVNVSNAARGGEISQDETWSGTITVTESIFIPKGKTLKILPGTTIKFKHSRNYKNPNKLSLEAQGRLLAVGTKDKLIRFTSDAKIPQNGDWSMIRLFGKTKSRIKYAIIEFGQQGVNLWKSDAVIAHSIVRWNNWEGLYAESYSTPIIEYNRVYQNGYNGMAMEQFNKAVVRYNIFEKSGTHGLHIDASEAVVENNILRNNGAAGLSLDDHSAVTAKNNTIGGNKIHQIMCGEGANVISALGNNLTGEGDLTNCAPEIFTQDESGSGALPIAFAYKDKKWHNLGYTPGDRTKDKYRYVYPNDKSRRIVKKIGKGLGLAWSVALEGNDIWAATVSGSIYKLSGTDGSILKELKVPSAQPWGMTFDGTNIWITDFAEKRTYSLDPGTGVELYSFKNPDQERGAKGLTWDGRYLYIMGWTTSTIYKMDRLGNLIKTIKFKNIDAGGGLAFDGKNFWAPCGHRICRFSSTGVLNGAVYSASEGTWDLAWEPAQNKYGGFLWATQRTNENWYDDAKIFKLEVLDTAIAK